MYYVPLATLSTANVYTDTTQPTTSLSQTAVPTGTTLISQPSTRWISFQDLALLLASTPERPSAPVDVSTKHLRSVTQCHEWFGQFKNTQLTDDVKLTYLKTLVRGKTNTAISKSASCGRSP